MTAEQAQENGEPATNGAIVAVGDVKSAGGAIVPVSGVSSFISEAQIKEAQKIATHTKALGIILPPPDIRQIIDKTAQFVARNGVEFERRILANEKNNVKFNFLIPTDAYHPYYRLRVKEFGEGDKPGEAKKDGGDVAATAAAAAAAAQAAIAPPVVAPTPVATQAVTGRPLEEPEKEKYTLHVPEGLTMYDLDVMKLTAQFVARNGKDFLTGLVQREQSNPQFQFLKPLNSLHQFFITMTNAYFEVLNPPRGYKQKLIKDGEDKSQILERCLKRLEWEKARAREAKEAADELERERAAMAAIDWHDFTVVETIDFLDEEDLDLPPPMSQKDVVALNKARAFEDVEEEGADEAAPAAAPATEDVEMDEEERQLVQEGAAAAAAADGLAAPTEPAAPEPEEAPLPPPATTAPAVDVSAAPAVAEDEEDEEPTGPIIRGVVRRDMARPGLSYDPTKFLVSPITGELVPISEMSEHMRISLIDPKWKEQKEAMLAKFRDTTKAGDDEISRNLIGLARTRPDIFGSTDEEVSQAVSQTIKEKLMSGTGRPVVWDGQTKSGSALDNQVKQIQDSKHEMAGKRMEAPKPMPTPILGPPPTRSLGPPGMGNLPPPTGAPPHMRPPPQPFGMPPPPRPSTSGMPPPMRPPPAQPFASMPPPPAMPMRPPPQPFGMPPPPAMLPPGLPPGMPPPPGAPAPPREAPPPMPEDEPEAKRVRLDFVLEPEEDFLLKFPGNSKVRVQCPEVEGNDKLIGQILEVEVASLKDTINHLKDRLAVWTNVPANKMSLRRDGVGFIKDETGSLAHYNVSPDVILALNVKERGGRKKA